MELAALRRRRRHRCGPATPLQAAELRLCLAQLQPLIADVQGMARLRVRWLNPLRGSLIAGEGSEVEGGMPDLAGWLVEAQDGGGEVLD